MHPFTMVIYWFEFNPINDVDVGMVGFILQRMAKSFSFEMAPMSSVFVLLGGGIGITLGYFYKALRHRNRQIHYLTKALDRDLESIIKKGEEETVEFKSSLRWNFQSNKVDKSLEMAVIKTIAGFMNNHLGTLIIGVNDSGRVIGLTHDYSTLKRKNRDGFEQHLITLISSKLGADLCPLIHVLFHNYEGKDVCRIITETSPRPVYVRDGNNERYYLRTGNSTRELTVHEAIEHAAKHWPHL